MTEKKQNLLNKLYKANTKSTKPLYKRLYIKPDGTDYKLRLLDTSLIDPEGMPLHKVFLHGGFRHPNYPKNTNPSTFACMGKGCPLCRDYFETADMEFKSGISRGKGVAWKKERTEYGLMWALNRANQNEMTLVYLQDKKMFKKNNKTGKKERVGKATVYELVYEKMVAEAKQGRDPFDLDKGFDIIIRGIKRDDSIKWSVHFEYDKPNKVEAKERSVLSKMPVLSEIFTPYSKDQLECIAKGIKFSVNKPEDASNQLGKKSKKDLETKISQENLNENVEPETINSSEANSQEENFVDENFEKNNSVDNGDISEEEEALLEEPWDDELDIDGQLDKLFNSDEENN